MKKSISSKRLSNIELFKDITQNKKAAKSLLTEIKQMNKELKSKHFLSDSKFNSKEFINNALKTGLCITEKNNIKNHNRIKIREMIKELKENAKVKYISNNFEKSKKNMNEEFEEILDKCNEETRIKLNKFLDDLIQTKNEQIKIIIENQTLESQIENKNNETQTLKKQLSEKNNELNKIIKKLDVYEKVKPFFELIRKFPEEEPKQIMSLFFNNKIKLIDLLHKINNFNEEYEDINKLRNKEQIKELKFKENIIERINEKKNYFDNKNKIIELDILNHEKQYEMVQKNKEEGMKHKKLLLFIFNLIKKFIPDKDYNNFIKQMKYKSKYTEENFDYRIFSNPDYINLIKNYIINKVSKCTEGILLRNTIVLGNYLSRKYLDSNKKEIYRYNPIKTYKDFKLYFDKINIKNFTLKRKFDHLKYELDGIQKEKNNIENIFNSWKLKYNELYDNPEMASIIQKNDKNKKDIKIIKNYKLNHLIKRKTLKKFSEENKIIIDDNNNEKISKDIHRNIDKFFITDINKINKRNENQYKTCLSHENYGIMRNKFDNNAISIQEKYKNLSINNKFYLSKYFINLKDYKLSMSKNRDKLVKKNGINRNIMKKTKSENSLKSFSDELNNYKDISSQVINSIDKMINSIKTI